MRAWEAEVDHRQREAYPFQELSMAELAAPDGDVGPPPSRRWRIRVAAVERSAPSRVAPPRVRTAEGSPER